MSRFERAFCRGAMWRSSSAAIARELRAQRLGPDVLEIGAGGGSVAQQLFSKNLELAWVAIDIDPHMTRAAATRLVGFPNATVKTADATAMPFPDDSFDSVVSCLMLHHIIDWERAVAEVARVVRPGGTLVSERRNLMAAPLGIRARAALVGTLFALPKPVRRLLAGAPVRIDGQELALDAQLMIWLKHLSGSDVFTDPVEESRTRYEQLSLVIGYETPVPVAAREISIPAEHGGIPPLCTLPRTCPSPRGCWCITTAADSRSAHA